MDFSFYKTEILEVILEDIAFKMLQIKNVDELFEHLIAKGLHHEDVKDERIPYWAELWPSAIGMSQYLIQKQVIQAGKSVIELGCGLGLPGIVAGKLGATVTFTDYLEDALVFARQNWQLNHPRQAAQFVKMDWREPNPALAADIVLASDVTYEERFFAFLPEALRQLCKPEARIIMSDPSRAIAEVFFSNLEQQGFKILDLDQLKIKNFDINIYHLRVLPLFNS